MIAASGIEDQELAVITEGAGIDYPAVAGGGNLGPRPGRDGEALFGAADPVGTPEFLDSDAIDRQREQPLGGREGDRRREPPGVLEGGQIGPNVQSLFFVAG